MNWPSGNCISDKKNSNFPHSDSQNQYPQKNGFSEVIILKITNTKFIIMKYKKHIFICTNQKAAGKACCGEERGMELVEAFKNLVKEHRLNTEIRAQRAGCFDTCAHGPSIVVYPEGIFYGKVQLSDVAEIFDEHILNDRPVERLKLEFK
jgi:(2Fe-2S) ferredoxin